MYGGSKIMNFVKGRNAAVDRKCPRINNFLIVVRLAQIFLFERAFGLFG
jgi:hypothetical protein